MTILPPSSRPFAMLLAAFLLAPAPVQAQSPQTESTSSSADPTSPLPEAPVPAPIHAAPHQGVETSLAVGVFADVIATRIQNVGSNGSILAQSATPVAGVAWSFRQSFAPLLGYSVNMSFARTSMHNASAGTFANAYGWTNHYTPVDQYELSLSWIAQKHITPKLTGFTEAGAGMVTFLPEDRGAKPLSTPYYLLPPVTFRPEAVLGLGVDYHFNPRWALRAEYRGLIFKYPDFGGATGKNLTVSSQPTVSITYTFGAKKKPAAKSAPPNFY